MGLGKLGQTIIEFAVDGPGEGHHFVSRIKPGLSRRLVPGGINSVRGGFRQCPTLICIRFIFGCPPDLQWRWSIARSLNGRCTVISCTGRWPGLITLSAPTRWCITYHLINDKDKHTIPMAWWNGPVLVALVSTPFIFASWAIGSWGVVLGALLASGCYYGAYEYMHWCMHLPKKRDIERSGIYVRLNGHHLLHPRYMHKNFNVVLPLADLCLGTLLLRSKVHFKQAEGPAVPNVQPRARKARLPKFAAAR